VAGMISIHQITFGFLERLSRAFLGTVLLILSFAYAINSDWFAAMHFVAMYPLLTALIAWDPVYMIIDLVKERWVDYWILHG